MLRDADDLLGKPDWTKHNARCQFITLEQALTDNPSITVRLQSTKLKRTLIHPSNRVLSAPSNMDLFTVEKPQDFINPSFINQNKTNNERKIIKPFIFDKTHAANKQ